MWNKFVSLTFTSLVGIMCIYIDMKVFIHGVPMTQIIHVYIDGLSSINHPALGVSPFMETSICFFFTYAHHQSYLAGPQSWAYLFESFPQFYKFWSCQLKQAGRYIYIHIYIFIWYIIYIYIIIMIIVMIINIYIYIYHVDMYHLEMLFGF